MHLGITIHAAAMQHRAHHQVMSFELTSLHSGDDSDHGQLGTKALN